jgi:hypothetical protein
VAHLRNDCGRPGIGCVNVEPEPLALAHVGDFGDGVNARRRGRAHGGDDAEGKSAGTPVFFNQMRERGGVHAELGVGGNLAQRALAEAERDERLLDRRVRLFRGVETEQREVGPPAHPLFTDAQIQSLARGRDGVHGGDRGRVVDDAAELRG